MILGPVTQVVLIKDPKGKSRGYGFVEYESSKDLTEAYKDADGRKVSAWDDQYACVCSHHGMPCGAGAAMGPTSMHAYATCVHSLYACPLT